MSLRLKILDIAHQISALTEVKLKLQLRFKFALFIQFFSPLTTIIMPLIVMGALLNLTSGLGPWNAENYVIFIFIAYNIIILKGIIRDFPNLLLQEKYWKTINALMIAPFNKFVLLISIFLSHIIITAIPLIFFFIVLYIYYPISIYSFIFIIILFFILTIIFSGIGLLIGVFAISEENIMKLLIFGADIFFWFSCITYPYELFPDYLQNLINFNPLYYIFDLIRYAWLEDDVLLTINIHFFNLVIMILVAVILPILGIIIFNKAYRKYGISGY